MQSELTTQLEDLFTFLRFPSVSTDSRHAGDVRACAEWLIAKLTAIGLTSELHETPKHPVVIARNAHLPGRRTVLIYGHYDVQPIDPLALWSSAPFEPEIRQGKIWARGCADNKGQMLAHVLGVEKTLREHGELPVNLIFLFEGEEEIGSPSLAAFLASHREELQCDIIAISDTGMVAPGVPTLGYGLRGMAACEVILRGPSRDLHSGLFGGVVVNPASAMARLIASLHTVDGHVAIAGFYDQVRPLETWEREMGATIPGVKDEDYLAVTGSSGLFGEPGYTSAERVWGRPTAEVNGMGSGYQGEGSKTVIPAEAFVKLTFRLVPDQSPEEIIEKVEAHLRLHCPPGVQMEIRAGHEGKPYVTDPNSRFGLAAQSALRKAFQAEPVLVREGGSIPIVQTFRDVLGVDSLLLGLALSDAQIHSPDENFPVVNFEAGIRLNQALLRELATVPLDWEKSLGSLLGTLNCQTGTLHRTAADGATLDLVCQIGVPEFLLAKISNIPFGKGIAGAAAERKEPVELCNLQQDLGGVAQPSAQQTGVSGSIAVPIFSPGTQVVIGTLGVGMVTPHDFTAAEKERIQKYAAGIAQSLI